MEYKITVNTKRKIILNSDWRKLGYKDLENHYLYNKLKYEQWENIIFMAIRAMETIRIVSMTLNMARRKGIKLDDKCKYNNKEVTEAIDNLREEAEIAIMRHNARIFQKMKAFH